MTDITYQMTTLGIAGQSTPYCRDLRPGAPISSKVGKLRRVTTHCRGFRPRNSPGAALTVRQLRGPPSPAIEAFRPEFC
jgi:hypothetical protein